MISFQFSYANCLYDTSFPSFTFNLLESIFKVHSYRQHIVGVCFLDHSDNLCLLTGVFSQLIVNVIIVRVQFRLPFYSFFGLFPLFFVSILPA